MKIDRNFQWRIAFYFRRGHGIYFSYVISISTFVVVVYQLAMKNIPILNSIFPTMLSFTVTFAVVYLLVASMVGWIDLKRGSYPTEMNVAFDNHPRFTELLTRVRRVEKKIDMIAEEKNG